jgi:AcrR family transcriptional regulator
VPRQKQRTPELRAGLLRAALAILEADGVAAVTARSVARAAGTSTAAVYELFGAKGGLVRAVFFDGFAMLSDDLGRRVTAADPAAALRQTISTLRQFMAEHAALAQVMFGRPFAEFDPGPADTAAGAAVREFIVERARRAVQAGILAGDPTDIAHVLLALAQGLAGQESAGWLGTSRASVDRRWSLGAEAVLRGLEPR